jgi:hypothetical protein
MSLTCANPLPIMMVVGGCRPSWLYRWLYYSPELGSKLTVWS